MVRANKTKLKFTVRNIFILPIKFYRIFISPWLGTGKCCFYPTCSSFAIEAIAKKGIIKGLILSLLRLMKCHPWSKGGYDPVK